MGDAAGVDGVGRLSGTRVPSFSVLTALSSLHCADVVRGAAVSFSHNTSGHCKPELCIRTRLFTADITGTRTMSR
ncbi:hypothetical protein SLA_3778 [Streptomyces laurentii]|uniref:Uncharacterized protein n=1 Tax=Streptomyces laurentii TaxID=39478 RepID=A0A160P2K0_STRLU|nr:hypothetical protein SLA_3778 [Streptomyces laurentii]